jgi:predicted N-acyltransferase
MTEAKKKANELVDKYIEYVEAYSSQGQLENAKICALIAVNEILNNDGFTRFDQYLTEFWREVKREIQAIKS